MPAGAILVAMSSYMRSTHAALSPGTRVPAVYPPSALNLSGLGGGGSGGRGKTMWDVGDAVAHGVVSVDAVQATGWCDVVRVSLRVHRLASVTIRIPEGLAVEPLAWSHQRLLALLRLVTRERLEGLHIARIFAVFLCLQVAFRHLLERLENALVF